MLSGLLGYYTSTRKIKNHEIHKQLSFRDLEVTLHIWNLNAIVKKVFVNFFGIF